MPRKARAMPLKKRMSFGAARGGAGAAGVLALTAAVSGQLVAAVLLGVVFGLFVVWVINTRPA